MEPRTRREGTEMRKKGRRRKEDEKEWEELDKGEEEEVEW